MPFEATFTSSLLSNVPSETLDLHKFLWRFLTQSPHGRLRHSVCPPKVLVWLLPLYWRSSSPSSWSSPCLTPSSVGSFLSWRPLSLTIWPNASWSVWVHLSLMGFKLAIIAFIVGEKFTCYSWNDHHIKCTTLKTDDCVFAQCALMLFFWQVKVTPTPSSAFTLKPYPDPYSSCLCANGRKTFKWVFTASVLGLLWTVRFYFFFLFSLNWCMWCCSLSVCHCRNCKCDG